MPSMDLLRGIEPTRPTPYDKGPETSQLSRDGSISLDDMSMGSLSPVDMPVFARKHDPPVDRSDLTNSPLLLMVPSESAVMGQLRPASPEGRYPLHPPAASTSLSPPSPILPLHIYLMDKNDHERRLLRLSGCPSLALHAARLDFGSEPEWSGRASRGPEAEGLSEPLSSWDYVERDEELHQETHRAPAAAHKRNVEAARMIGSGLDDRRKMARPAPTGKHRPVSPLSAASLSSSPRADVSTISDLVADAPLAARHISLHRELQRAGLGGLGTSAHSRLRYHR
ncbi:hypothetical protein HRG_009643 [Hirsutella rhossiliensis]|uniref:Uncharacterized protein n=1 Tax=Hirsutella rhossiliensis TaxID=111463 RepID=A0A9P8MQE4_9HYPO|nr:uncharacterized protein HRG_09643 [Hirsutella rhossiliensis]KAH0959182.1 hypothetical protein HRG_09643 [Hirsutella rhossiliensis]